MRISAASEKSNLGAASFLEIMSRDVPGTVGLPLAKSDECLVARELRVDRRVVDDLKVLRRFVLTVLTDSSSQCGYEAMSDER